MTASSEAHTTKMTLLTVCLSDEQVLTVLGTAKEQHWIVTHAHFDLYISARRRPHMPAALRSGDGCLALVDFDADPEQAIASAHYLQQVFSHRIVIMAVSALKVPSAMLSAMQAGCSEFLPSPVEEQSLHTAFMRAESAVRFKTTAITTSGSVLTLLGAKGGVGTTTLGVHLAVYLVRNNKRRVLLIDSKAQFGHVSIYLGMDGSSCHLQELVSNVNRLDSELLQAFVGHHPSGLDLLSSPDLGQTARAMHPEDLALTLEFLRGEYDFIIVDCDDPADEITAAVLTSASQVYLVATPDITAVRDLSRHVDDLSRMDTSCQIQVVVNRYSSQFAVSLQEIEKAIRMPVSFSVPNNYIELVRSANLGEPIGPESQSGFTVELLQWAHSLDGTGAAHPPETYAESTKKHLWQSITKFLPGLRLPFSATSPVERRA